MASETHDHDATSPKSVHKEGSDHDHRSSLSSEHHPSRDSGVTAQNAPPGGPRKYAHGFFSPVLAKQRAMYIGTLAKMLAMTVVVMWLCLPVYWGSLAHQRSYTNKLNAYFINRDGAEIGTVVQDAFQANIAADTHHKLRWIITDSSSLPTEEDVADAVVGEHVWVAVVVNAGATAALTAARQNGDSSYNGTSAITIYYDQGRNELATANYVLPYTQAILSQAMSNFSATSAAQYIQAQAGNSTALSALTRAPQTISQPVYYTLNNLRPFDAPVATAIILVGNIYVVIFSFIVTMANYGVIMPLQPFLTTKAYIGLRLAAPPVMYFFLSLSYSMISLPFKVPFDAKFTYAGGFFTFWALIFLAMVALGFATEAMITLLTPRFMTFFLLPLIISNVSVASLPIALEPWFYKYGYGFPIYNMAQATRTIIFNTKSHLGLNAGVLIAWIALSCVTIPLFTILVRRRDQKAALAAERAEEERQRELEKAEHDPRE